MSASQKPSGASKDVAEKQLSFLSHPVAVVQAPSGDGTAFITDHIAGKQPNDKHLADMLRKTLDIMMREEKLPEPILYETMEALAAHGKSNTSTAQHQKQPYIGSIANGYECKKSGLEIDPLPPNDSWSEMVLKGNECDLQLNFNHNPNKEPTQTTNASESDEVKMTDTAMPWAPMWDFITTNFDSNQGSGAKNDNRAWQGPAKNKGDLNNFITLVEKVLSELNQDVCETTITETYQLTQCSQQKLLLDSIRQFIMWLKENEATLKIKYGAPYDRAIWVLSIMGKFTSVTEIICMLVLCSVVVSGRGEYNTEKSKGKRKRSKNNKED